ncbi:2014_t:CDS:2 [Ambispora leptoticha]|uniref:2014_t:CDS:1 n=1 Tax=Ambispora leptoticha TaxID=144679 RepID=A0A9N9AAT7_9GLOM|nr:2014_t:CDS:2 [Ambispora leptoticha]
MFLLHKTSSTLPISQLNFSTTLRHIGVRNYVSALRKAPRKIGLGSLSDNPKATRQRRRVGRGPASGKGKTCGAGIKGQKARSGNTKPRRDFEGGQTPITRLFPKQNADVVKKELTTLELDRLQHWIDRGLIDPNHVITTKQLADTRCVRGVRKDGILLLGRGAQYFKTPITIEISRAAPSAIRAIEQVGGHITCRYYNRLALRVVLHPEKFWRIPKFAYPVRQKDIDYYTDPSNRGYLADPKELERLRQKNINIGIARFNKTKHQENNNTPTRNPKYELL